MHLRQTNALLSRRARLAHATCSALTTLTVLSGCATSQPGEPSARGANSGASVPTAVEKPAVSDPAFPQFAVPDLDGKVVSITDFRGKVVMVQFWATWCHSCSEEIRNLDRIYQNYEKDGLVILGVAVDDSAERLRAFRDEFHIKLPILVDTGDQVKNTFRLMGLPVMQALDRTGRITTMEDPKTKEFTERVSGTREWITPEGIASIERLLRQNPGR